MISKFNFRKSEGFLKLGIEAVREMNPEVHLCKLRQRVIVFVNTSKLMQSLISDQTLVDREVTVSLG